MHMSHDEWVEGVARVLRERGETPTMILIDGPRGLELLVNHENFALQMGMCDICRIMIGQRFAMMAAVAQGSGEAAAILMSLENTMKGKTGGMN